MKTASRFAHLAGSAFAALGLASATQAQGLVDNPDALLHYTPTFSAKMAKVAGNADAHGTAGGFMKDMEARLKSSSDKAQVVIYPKETTVSMLAIAGVVPPAGLDDQPIKVCAQQHNRVLTVLDISQQTGDVTEAKWEGSRNGEIQPDGRAKPACMEFVTAARAQYNRLAAERGAMPAAVAAAANRTAANLAAKP